MLKVLFVFLFIRILRRLIASTIAHLSPKLVHQIGVGLLHLLRQSLTSETRRKKSYSKRVEVH